MIFVFFLALFISVALSKKQCENANCIYLPFQAGEKPLKFIKEELEPAFRASIKEALQVEALTPELQEMLTQSATEKLFKSSSATNKNASINDWNELYASFPQLKSEVAKWRDQFIVAVKDEKEIFKDCANPASLAKILVPTFDELQARRRTQ